MSIGSKTFLEVKTVIDYLMFIDDAFRASAQGGVLEVINPATGEPYAMVASASGEDVEDAVAAAKHAQPDWAKLPAIELRGHPGLSLGMEAFRHRWRGRQTRTPGIHAAACRLRAASVVIKQYRPYRPGYGVAGLLVVGNQQE